ncbi:hypothetical protein ACLK1T_05950 [Escherichia coli]
MLLTDQKGLYTALTRAAIRRQQPIKDVYGHHDALRAIAGGAQRLGLGTGGMSTKLQAADVACRAGIYSSSSPRQQAGRYW